MIKDNRGITIIALVVTIIILLILAGVSLNIGKNSIIDRTIEASNKSFDTKIEEQLRMAYLAKQIDDYVELQDDEKINEIFKENLSMFGEIKNVQFIRNNPNEEKAEYDDNLYGEVSFQCDTVKYKWVIRKDEKSKLYRVIDIIDSVKVGEYFEYPISYTDMYSSKEYTQKNGWIVIDDGIMEGTSGSIKLISAGIPAKWYYVTGNEDNISNLLENNSLIMKINNRLAKRQSGEKFVYENFVNKVTTLSVGEINLAYNKIYGTSRELNDISDLGKGDKIFLLKDIIEDNPEYWLSNVSTESGNLYYMSPGSELLGLNQINDNENDVQKGIRPVIWLKNNIEILVSDDEKILNLKEVNENE